MCSGTLKQPGEAEREPRTANRQRTGNGATTVRGHAEVTPAWLGWWVPLSSNSRKATKTRRQILICHAQPVRVGPGDKLGAITEAAAWKDTLKHGAETWNFRRHW